jgi:protein tyrosine phosphatase (PTP) superfamily phosphohydrolase (DUF442 family)
MKGKLFTAVIGIILAMHVTDVMGQEIERKFEATYPLLRGIPNVVALKEGIVGGGAPSEEDLRIASELGFRTVVDLRTANETTKSEFNEKSAVYKNRMNYIRIEVSKDSLSRYKAERLANVAQDPENLPMIIHCSDGQRAAALYALYLKFFKDVGASTALQKAQGAGLKTGSIMDKTKELLGIKEKR